MIKKYRQNDDKGIFLFAKALFEENHYNYAIFRFSQCLELK